MTGPSVRVGRPPARDCIPLGSRWTSAVSTSAVLLLVSQVGCQSLKRAHYAARRQSDSAEAADLARIERRERHRADPDRWLVARLLRGTPRGRARAALALGRIDPSGAFAPLMHALGDPAPEVRASAAFALRLHVLNSTSSPDLQRAREGLRRALDAERAGSVKQRILSSLGCLGDASDLRRLESHARGDSTEAALWAWGLLARRVIARADARQRGLFLNKALRDGPTPLRRAAAWAAGGLAPAFGALERALEHVAESDDDEDARLWAVRAVGQADSERRVHWLAERFSAEAAPRVQLELARGLASGGARGAERLALGLRELWRLVSARRHRLVGPELQPVLFAIRALHAHRSNRQVAEVLRDLSRATELRHAVIDYGPLERRRIELVHRATTGALAGRRWAGAALPLTTPVPAEPPPGPAAETGWPAGLPLPTRAVLVTETGEVDLELFAEAAPLAVARFAHLASQRAYHAGRVESLRPNEHLAIGPASPARPRRPSSPLPSEPTDRPFDRGSVGFVAPGGDGVRQRFFVSLVRAPALDGLQTLFARVVRGLEHLERLQPGDQVRAVYLPDHPP